MVTRWRCGSMQSHSHTALRWQLMWSTRLKYSAMYEPNTFLLWKWQLQQQETHTHPYQAPKHLISYLMIGGIMQPYSRHQATCQLLAPTSIGHIARAPARDFCSKNCHRDWGNLRNSQCFECSCHTDKTILGNSKVHLTMTMSCQLHQVIWSLPYKV